MKKLTVLLLTLFCLSGLHAWGQERGDNGNSRENSTAPASRPAVVSRPVARPVSNRPAPVVINMNRGSSGGHNRNYPSQQPANPQPVRNQPSYGQLHWNNQVATRPAIQPGITGQAF